MGDIFRPTMAKVVWALAGAALVAYTGLGRLLPKRG